MDTLSSEKGKIAKVLCELTGGILFLLAFAAVWRRAGYGLDVTDESYWVADPFLVAKGAVPYANLWIQTPGTSILIAPWIALYLAIAGSTAGIALYMMRVAVVFRAAASAAVWRLLRRCIGSGPAWAVAIALFCVNPMGCKGLNYNVFSIHLLALAGALLYHALTKENDDRGAAREYVLAGIVMALCTLAHATQAINALLFMLLLILLERRKYRRFPLWGVYAAGGLLAAIPVTVWLEIAGRGRVFAGIATMLRTSNYFKIPYPLEVRWGNGIAPFIASGKAWLCAFLAAMVLALLLARAIFDVFRESIRFCFVGAVIFANAALTYYDWYRRFFLYCYNVESILFLTVPLLLLGMKKAERVRARDLLLFFWLPALIAWLMVSAISPAPANYRYYVLTQGTLLCIPFAKWIFSDIPQGNKGWGNRCARTCMALALMQAAGLAASFVCWDYENIYRDEPVPQLTYRMETGVYRGLYTTPERGHAIEELEAAIRSTTVKGEKLMILDLFPAGYLMTDANAFTPTSWDPCMYEYGFEDMNMLRAYFSLKEAIPDKIMFIDSHGAPLSIDDEKSEVCGFIRENYTEIYEDPAAAMPIRVYSRNTSLAG